MVKAKLISFFVLLVSLPVILFAQNINSISPYTQYGYGQLADPSFGAQRAMGGIGYGLRNSETINPLNPASYSAVDSMTFMLDFGLKGQIGWLNEGDQKAKKYMGGLDYIAMQFPLAKRLGMGIGMAPISRVGYKFREWKEREGEFSPNTYSGSGGVNKVYGTLSYALDKFSFGINVGYLFGNILKDGNVLPNSESYRVTWSDSLRTSGLIYDIGVQYKIPLNNKKELVVGAVYTPKTKISNHYKSWEISYDSGSATGNPEQVANTKDIVFQMPETFAVGMSYNKLNHLTIGADFQYQRWSDAKYFGATNVLSDRIKINLGVEYIPDNMAYNVLQKTRYRAGAYYTNSYVDIDGYGFKDYGFTLGLGIPMVDRRSFINMAFEYNMVNPEKRPNAVMVDEKYFRFTFSYTFNELWFFKRKLQ